MGYLWTDWIKGGILMVYSNGRLYMLNALIEKVKGLNFSIQTQYKFLKINKVVQSELDIYEQ